MDFGNCPVCGKLYSKNPMGMCNDCFVKEEEYGRIVAEYVRDHHRCTVNEVHMATGVSEKVIYRMIKSGRILECKDLQYPCAQCGKLINAGRLCKNCMKDFVNQATKMTNNMKSKMVEENKKKTGGMYTKDMGSIQ